MLMNIYIYLLVILIHCTVSFSFAMMSSVLHYNTIQLRMSSTRLKVVLWYLILSHTNASTSSNN